MQDPALGRQQPVVGRLLHERMTESVAFDGPVLVDEQELGGDRAAQRQAQVVFRHPADLGEEVVFDLPAGHRGDLDQPAGVLRAGREADLEDAAQGLGQALATAAGLVGGSRQFLGEERVAVGTPDDRIDESRGRWRTGDAGQQLDHLVALEPRQRRCARRAAGARSRPATRSADGGDAVRRCGRSRP